MEPTQNLPVMTVAKYQRMQQEILDLKAQLKLAEHKRQETLASNVELLGKLAEKDNELASMTQRFNFLKTKKANGVLNEEIAQLQKKIEFKDKQIVTLKKAESGLKEKY